MARCFWARVLLLSLPLADSVLPRHRRKTTVLSATVAEAHLWKAHDAVKSAAPSGSTAALRKADGEKVVNVYMIRHGQSVFNEYIATLLRPFLHPFKYLAKHGGPWPPRAPEGGFSDAHLTEKGLRQAALAQGVLSEKLGLQSVPAEKVRLAASLNGRAFDTFVIATKPLWQKWAATGSSFLVQSVPALMECDPSVYSQRRKGVALDDPVRWEDSMLSQNVSEIVGFDVGTARSLFYQTAEDRSQSTTRKPVEVRTTYSRGADPIFGVTCSAAHMAQYKRFLVDTVRAGKEHILIGAHGTLARDISRVLGADPSRAVPIDGQVGSFWPAWEALPNAAVLHLHLRVSAGGRPILEPRRLYPNPIFST